MPVDPSIVAAGITAASTLTSQGANAYAVGKSNRKTREYGKEMYERQKADNQYYWNLQNEYNSPKKQMERLKEAKLNPALIYGNGSVQTGQAQSVSNSTPASYRDEPVKLELGGLADAFMIMQKTQMMQAEKALIEARKANVDSGTVGKDSQNRVDLATEDTRKEKRIKDLEFTQRAIQVMLDKNEREQKVNPVSISEQVARIAYMAAQTKNMAVQQDEIRQRIENLKTQNKISDEQLRLLLEGKPLPGQGSLSGLFYQILGDFK